ncbi:MAG: xanthine dehydrogenase family protein subunit M [Gemmatirosa sp.]|nr:xanthine dehydrogenase family protein subunit M [Gemmatirosa sp.]
MRTAVSGLDLRRAASLDEALRLRRDEGRTPIAGATDVYVALNFGTLRPTRFVDLWGLQELRGVAVRDGALVLGALTTYTDCARSPLVAERLPMLADASRLVGGLQIQNRGTLGGNVANASPAGDSLPVLAAVDAVVVLRSVDGERRVPFDAFYTGYRATVMRDDELVVAIEVPPVAGRQWFRKVGTRAAQAISKIVVAAVRDGDSARVAFGSVAPTVVRARAAEAVLGAGGSIDDAVAALGTDVAPIDDLRSTAAYRLTVAGNLMRRFWAETS